MPEEYEKLRAAVLRAVEFMDFCTRRGRPDALNLANAMAGDALREFSSMADICAAEIAKFKERDDTLNSDPLVNPDLPAVKW